MQVYNLFGVTLSGQAVSLGGDLIDVADHVEGDLGQVIIFASKDLLESGDSLVNGDQLARVVGEHLSDLDRQLVSF